MGFLNNVLDDSANNALKADKVVGATNGNVAKLDSSGNLVDSGIASSAVVTLTGSQALTNKTLAAGSNTITGIADANVASGAAIDAAKIGTGSVSNTEFEYLDGVSSALQTQLDAKQNASTAVMTSRTVSTTAPLSGGGALSGNLTLTVSAADASNAGTMSAAQYSLVNGATSANTASTIVKRDGSGGFSAGQIQTINGNSTALLMSYSGIFYTSLVPNFHGSIPENNWLQFNVCDGTTTGQRTVMSLNGGTGHATIPDGNLFLGGNHQIQIASVINERGLQLLYQADSFGLVGTMNATPLIFRTTSAERMRIAADGKIGIGVNSPTVALDVAGDIKATGNTVWDGGANFGNSISMQTTNNSGASAIALSTPSGYAALTQYGSGLGSKAEFNCSDSLRFMTNGNVSSGGSGHIEFITGGYSNSPCLYISSGQMVGINNVSPTTALDVTGTVTATAFVGDASGMTSVPPTSLATAITTSNDAGSQSIFGLTQISGLTATPLVLGDSNGLTLGSILNAAAFSVNMNDGGGSGGGDIKMDGGTIDFGDGWSVSDATGTLIFSNSGTPLLKIGTAAILTSGVGISMNDGSGAGGGDIKMDGGSITRISMLKGDGPLVLAAIDNTAPISFDAANANGVQFNGLTAFGVGGIQVTGALADGTYSCGTGSITITNGAISAIS